MTNRRTFLTRCAAAGLSSIVGEALWNRLQAENSAILPGAAELQGPPRITREMIRAAEAIAGVEFTDAERDLMLERLESNLTSYQAIRLVEVPYQVPPAVQFSPLLAGKSYPITARRPASLPHPREPVQRPKSDADLAFLTVIELAQLLRRREVTATELTHLYLDRLARYNPTLNCVVTLTTERALRKAAEADRQIAAGAYRGILHGIPYGVKDILAVSGYPTTWGAALYKDRVLDETATVVQRLDAAGAILVAKLSMGELGLSDSWFRGRTMNPWRTSQGAGGSSAGSAVAVAAGLVGFALGAETMGSLVTPATRNGVTGLRPTFGLVSRHGAMPLCWSLDKIGPMARSVEDCAAVLGVIAGPDGKDSTVVPAAYAWDPSRPLTSLRVGYFAPAFDAPSSTKVKDNQALATLRRLGIPLREVNLPDNIPIAALLIIRVEAAAAFDEMTRSGELRLLKEQGATGFPNFFRSGRLVPAVEYLQANRVRQMFMQQMDEVFKDVDVFMAPSFGVNPATNLTGHPCVVVPNGLSEDGIPVSISFIGRLFGDSELCTVARAWQDAAGFYRMHPTGFTE
ncbi:MAG TPA: amidase [Gemmatimonadales bacterium]|jgi:Asp-tRNA(Asn)/Glu-tRNA(Gln) amidotransferase A subunit family amidase|nr:amidase [Gemmatimonadales bacterium]